MDVLVVSACSGEKQFDDVPIGYEEIDSSSRVELLGENPEYVAPASEMYTGDEHELVRTAVTNLRAHADVSWRIVSAGYGLLKEDEEIVAYDCSFSDIEPVRERVASLGHDPKLHTIDETRRTLGREKKIPGDLRREFAEGFDLVFIVLSEPYLVAASEALHSVPKSAATFAFASKGGSEHLGDAYWVPSTEDERAKLGTTWFSLRGELLRRLSKNVDKDGLARISDNHESIDVLLP